MKRIIISLFLLVPLLSFGQGRFEFPDGISKEKIPFQLLSNLVIVPVEINGVTLDFLLDTGVNATILFSIENKDSIQFNNAVPVKLRGLGDGKPIEAVKSMRNTFKIGSAVNKNQTVYIIFDQDLNFSPRLGQTVHGIIGFDFFKDFIVETNYVREQLVIHKPESYDYSRCRRCFATDLFFYNNKPYFDLDITLDGETKAVTLLLDSGSGDAIWLFKEKDEFIRVPQKSFEDFLGLGLSGNIFGDRSKVPRVHLGNYTLRDVNTAFPYSEAFANINLYPERDGSAGGELLKRFTTVIDYRKKKLQLKRNRYFKEPFYYNMSGLTLEHDGFEYVKERLKNTNTSKYGDDPNNVKNEVAIYQSNQLFAIKLAPVKKIAEIRPNSPSDLAGMRTGDIIVSLNGRPAHQYTLQELNTLFHSKEGRNMRFVISRNGLEFNISFKLQKVL